MNIEQALKTRRTVHDYRPEPVKPDALERALAAAHQAPCHKHTWPWRFTVVGQTTRQQMVPVAIRLKAGPNASDKKQAMIRAKVLNPGALIVVTQVRCDDPHRAHEDYAAVACAIQNLQLSAHGDGYGSKWSSGGLTTHPEIYELLGVDSAVEQIVGFVWMGIAAKRCEVKRPPLEGFIRRLP